MTGQQRFKALLFDFDDTLVPEYEVSVAAVNELCDEIREAHQTAHDLVETLRSTASKLIIEAPAGAAAIEEFGEGSELWVADELMWDDKPPLEALTRHLEDFRRMVWEETFRTVGIDNVPLAHDMAQRLPALSQERRVPYADAELVLSTLGQHHPMAILTNGEPRSQAHKVEMSGLKHHFAHVVLCHEHGGKPDLLPFQVALDLLGCQPDEVAMIGNSLANDIGGARNAGIFSVWVNRGHSNAWDAADVKPDATVTHLSELLDLL